MLQDKTNNNLLSNKRNIHSQNGEDGIIEAIFDRIGIKNRTCCEFGAWDGIHLSNCRKLILDGWSAVMIEGDEEKFCNLFSNYANNEKVICVNKYVDDAKNSLDTILREKKIPELDFLSIDIDGLDYEIFDTLDCKPRVICVEINAGHSPEFDSIIEKEIAKNNVGQSIISFVNSAKKMGGV